MTGSLQPAATPSMISYSYIISAMFTMCLCPAESFSGYFDFQSACIDCAARIASTQRLRGTGLASLIARFAL